MAASDHVGDLCAVGCRNRMAGMVCEYRDSEHLSADPGGDVHHIQDTLPVTKRIHDLLCNGIGIFDGASVYFVNDRGDPLQNTNGGMYRM